MMKTMLLYFVNLLLETILQPVMSLVYAMIPLRVLAQLMEDNDAEDHRNVNDYPAPRAKMQVVQSRPEEIMPDLALAEV